MNKHDFIPASAAIIVALAWFLFNIFSSSGGNICQVYENDMLINTHSLNDEGMYNLMDANGNIIMTYSVKNGYVDVVYSKCRDELCVKQKKINRGNETIVCLPQRIVFKIVSDKDEEFDGFTN